LLRDALHQDRIRFLDADGELIVDIPEPGDGLLGNGEVALIPGQSI
jgi:hypothetical protein